LPGMGGRKSTSSSKFWRWRTRSNKSTMSEADASMYGSPADSPLVTGSSRQPVPAPLVSPFLSESAHVRSLQHPSQHKEAMSCGGSQLIVNALAESDRSSSPETVIRVPPSPGSMARQILIRAKRGLGSKLRLKSARSVSMQCHDHSRQIC
jgi:hypothetical protein